MPKFVSPALRLAATLGVLAATVAVAAPDQSKTQTGDQFDHIATCLGLMLTDSERHAAECGPGHEFTGQFSYGWIVESGGGPSSEEPEIELE